MSRPDPGKSSDRHDPPGQILGGGALNALLNRDVPGRGSPWPGVVTSVPETLSKIMSRSDTACRGNLWKVGFSPVDNLRVGAG